MKLAAESKPDFILALPPGLTSYPWRLMKVEIPGGDEVEKD
jgi:hypothetical protein